MLGHAVADALGVPVEFRKREELKAEPVSDMRGFGTYPYPAGTWSDDTSMSLCALDVLAKGRLDLNAVMENFGKWYCEDEFTAGGVVFDVGISCRTAINNYLVEKKSVTECGVSGEYENGNGSLMRIHPFVLYCLARDGKLCGDNMSEIFAASDLTHRHARAAVGCGIYAFVLEALLNLPSKDSVKLGLEKARRYFMNEEELSHYERIFAPALEELPETEIKSSGYIVHTLEAALWCLLTTSSYKECVLRAVNLGDDTDTVGAVAGGLAGALYGYDAIPEAWLGALLRREYIEDMCDKAARAWRGVKTG